MTALRNFTPISDLISLSHKHAIITGGARGIGYAISRRLAEAGASVTIADIDAVKGKDAAQSLSEDGYPVAFVQCDVANDGDIEKMVKETTQAMGGIDILVNNAGVFPVTPFEQMTTEKFEHVLSVNLLGIFRCSQAVSKQMILQKQGGCIINIASIDALRPTFKGSSGYAASKAGVIAMTKSMALELGQYGIRVNAIAPGAILTEGALARSSGLPKEQAKAQLKEAMSHAVLGRMGEADDIGRVALFLASGLASYMTGTVVIVDGGYLLS